MNKYAIIVAGGIATRMQGEIPKQFMLINGKPAIQFSIDAFLEFDPATKIILVLHQNYLSYWEQQSKHFNINNPMVVVGGGETRFDSVKNGLELIETDGFVAIHDAARPVINHDFIGMLFSEAETFGSAIPGVVLKDTIRMIDGDTSHTLDRTILRAMQTPQVFRISELKRAYTQPFQCLFTDDAAVMQSAGFPIHVTSGRHENIKITYPEDVILATALINLRNTSGK